MYYLEKNKILILSGCNCAKVSLQLAKDGYLGAEFLSVIPGSIGGAIYMNAGAYGGEIKDVVKSVTYLDGGEIKTAKGDELDFGYRKSMFSGESRNATSL